MIDIKQYKTFFFDCDGVILDSNQIKTEAFRTALEKYPLIEVDEFIHFHEANGGVSRFKKFEHFFTNIHPVNNPSDSISKSLNLFSGITRKELERCKLINGVTDILNYALENSIQSYVVTAGAEDEVKDIFNKRDLSKYFEDILGSPKTKYENMTSLTKVGSILKNSLFFGDSKVDFEIAKIFGIDFLFVSGKSAWKGGDKYIANNGYEQIIDFIGIF